MSTEHLYQFDDDFPHALPNGQRIDTGMVMALGNTPWQPRTFATRCRLLDRLGRERAYGFLIFAPNRRQAELRAKIRKLGEVITGEVMAPEDIIPAQGPPE